MELMTIFILVVSATAQTVTAVCRETDAVCEFWLSVENRLTMIHGRDLVVPHDGKLYRWDTTNFSSAVPVSPDDVITADGWTESRMVAVVNGTMPGPAIDVFQGQTVVIHVANHMMEETTSLHWHGLLQRGTPWMDGVAQVSQCPILPFQSFTYRFKVDHAGTYWYHSHVGAQQSMGIFGALVVRSKTHQKVVDKHVMILQDWNHDWDSKMSHMKMVYGMYKNQRLIAGTSTLAGIRYSMFHFQAGLINGKGRYYNEPGRHNGAPLETFTVKEGTSNRFRVINAGAVYSFRISIDLHPLTLVALDGNDIKPLTVESIIINPGERVDFTILANQQVDNYWIRGRTLEVEVNNTVEAILHYEGAPDTEPTSSRQTCTPKDCCVVFNCPFLFYPLGSHTACITVDDIHSLDNTQVPDDKEHFKEYFLNFAFPGNSWTPGSVNGRVLQMFPSVSALTQPDEVSFHCDASKCGEDKLCKCPLVLNLQHGDTVQMVFLNLGMGKGWDHPIHMHGHQFYVLKMGYGRYNQTDGSFIGDNTDIDCRGNSNKSLSFCNDATWSDRTWVGGNVPGLKLNGAPKKDTVMVPSGGYVVIRIKSDNPGLWLMHCHIEIHMLDGMSMLLNESFPNVPPPPAGFPQCRSFRP
ncbi:laccase-1-like [Gigantopelta aegis]|uniref:laccase-1-like n=1 Tax=Gigantopelta aegis TaxID=1735272 RepID=UPI001B8897B6|nr:laccase-1-like [Gigantopelta aegis]